MNTDARGRRLYLAGHNHRLGQAISVELVDVPPVRYYVSTKRARRLVERFNSLAARRGVA